MLWALAYFVAGALALAYERPLARAINQFSITVGEMFPPCLKWPRTLPRCSKERERNYVFVVRFWGTWTAAMGVLALFVH